MGLFMPPNTQVQYPKKIARAGIQCTHEEADTRVFVHLKNAIEVDLITSCCILSNDTDIVVLAIAFFEELHELGLVLWNSLCLLEFKKTNNGYQFMT